MTPDSHTDTEATVLIQSNSWKVKDIYDEVTFCLTQEWHHEEWKPTPALIHNKSGTSSQYLGQKYDPDKIDLAADGWTHDHCAICWWTIHESDNEDEGKEYRNEYNAWLCSECYKQFIEGNALHLKTTGKMSLPTGNHSTNSTQTTLP